MKSQIGTLPLFLSHIREHSPRRGMGPDMRRDAVAGPSDARGGNLKRCLSVSGDMSQKRERLSLDEGPTIEAPGSPGGARDRAARISSNYSLCSGGSSRRSSTGTEPPPDELPPSASGARGSLTAAPYPPQSPMAGSQGAP